MKKLNGQSTSSFFENNIEKTFTIECDDSGGNRASITLNGGQYFPDSSQTNPPGQGYRFTATITGGNTDDVFSDINNNVTGEFTINKNPGLPFYILTLSDNTTLDVVVR